MCVYSYIAHRQNSSNQRNRNDGSSSSRRRVALLSISLSPFSLSLSFSQDSCLLCVCHFISNGAGFPKGSSQQQQRENRCLLCFESEKERQFSDDARKACQLEKFSLPHQLVCLQMLFFKCSKGRAAGDVSIHHSPPGEHEAFPARK